MNYNIIDPPYRMLFFEMPKKELKGYFQWYLYIIPERIEELANAVHQTPEFEQWQPDFTPKSLVLLGEWYVLNVERRSRTEKEIQGLREISKFPIDVFSDQELTEQTFSIAIDIGMYISQVFLKNHPSLKWGQPFGSKKSIDYGQPVIEGFGKVFFNPTQMMTVHAYSIADKRRTGKDLKKIYDIWSKLLID